MLSVIEDFEDRVGEIEHFFSFLEKLDKPDTELHVGSEEEDRHPIEPDTLRMLKACAYLILYNLVESAIRNGLKNIYNHVTNESCQYGDVSEELQKLWVKLRYRHESKENNATRSDFPTFAQKLIDDVMNDRGLELNEEAVRIAGNLDVREIKSLCKLHGIEMKTEFPKGAGNRMLYVKNRRNMLAHGEESFMETGRDSTLQDLVETKTTVVESLTAVLQDMEAYISEQAYKNKTAASV